MTNEEESCISDLKILITKAAADLIKEAAEDKVYLSFDASKFDDLFIFYKEIKDSVKNLVTKNKFLINKFKISSIISLSLCNKHLMSGQNKKQTIYYNCYLSLLASEQFIIQFSEETSNNKLIQFNEDFVEPAIKMIHINSSLINKDKLYKNKHIVLSCVYNLSYHYDLLHEVSLKTQ